MINDQERFDFQTKIQSTLIVTDQRCCEIWNLKDLEFRYIKYELHFYEFYVYML